MSEVISNLNPLIAVDFGKDPEAIQIVADYIKEHIDKTDTLTETPSVYIVWKSKTLQNWKYLISSTLHDGKYFELTYNGDKEEWYLDVYVKLENKSIKGGN